MLPPVPSLNYAFRSGFSYEKWLEDRSHANVIVTAIEMDMIERSDKMSTIVHSIDSLSEIQKDKFTEICIGLENLDDTLTWGFVEISDKLTDVETATYAVKDSVDKVDISINQLINVVNAGFKNVTWQLGDISASLQRIEDAVSDVHKSWAFSNYRRAVSAVEAGYVFEAIELLEKTMQGSSGHDAFNLDSRFHYLLGHCYAGNFGDPAPLKIDLEKAINLFESAIKYTKMSDDLSAEFIANCHLAAAWIHYCIGDFLKSENYYAKSIGINTSFDAEYGLAKTILAQGEFARVERLIRFCMLQYRNRFLIRAASDPDFIAYRNQIDNIRIEMVHEIQSMAAEVNTNYLPSVHVIENLKVEMTRMDKMSREVDAVSEIKDRILIFISGSMILDLTYIDEDGYTLELQGIISAIDNAHSRIQKAGVEIRKEIVDETILRISSAREETRKRYAEKVDYLEFKIRSRTSVPRLFPKFKKMFAASDEEVEILNLKHELEMEIDKINSGFSRDAGSNVYNKSLNICDELSRLKLSTQKLVSDEQFRSAINLTFQNLMTETIPAYAA